MRVTYLDKGSLRGGRPSLQPSGNAKLRPRAGPWRGPDGGRRALRSLRFSRTPQSGPSAPPAPQKKPFLLPLAEDSIQGGPPGFLGTAVDTGRLHRMKILFAVVGGGAYQPRPQKGGGKIVPHPRANQNRKRSLPSHRVKAEGRASGTKDERMFPEGNDRTLFTENRKMPVERAFFDSGRLHSKWTRREIEKVSNSDTGGAQRARGGARESRAQASLCLPKLRVGLTPVLP